MKKILFTFMVFALCIVVQGQKITQLPEVVSASDESLLMIRYGATGNTLSKITKANFLSTMFTSPIFTGTVTIPTPFILGIVSVITNGTELNYVGGVTSSIQTQLNTKIAKGIVDSVNSVGSYAKFYNSSGDTLNPYIPYADREEGVALADSSKTDGTGYTTPQDLGVATAVGFCIKLDPTVLATPVDATTYYWGTQESAGVTVTVDVRQLQIPYNCTLIGYSFVTYSTVAASAETGTISVRLNNTTDIQLSDAITWAVGGSYTNNYFSSTALSTNITAGDKIQMKLLTPTWTTDPANIYFTTVLYFKNR